MTRPIVVSFIMSDYTSLWGHKFSTLTAFSAAELRA